MKYALKALSYLAAHSDKDRIIPTHTIAEKENIPKKFLEQILLELKKAKIVKSVKGNLGGYFLAYAPQDIKLSAIYRIFEGPIALIPCASENFYEPCIDCPSEKKCKIRMAVLKLRLETLKLMDHITLAEL